MFSCPVSVTSFKLRRTSDMLLEWYGAAPGRRLDVLRHSHCKPEGCQLRRRIAFHWFHRRPGRSSKKRHKATSYRAYPDDSASFKYSIKLRNRRLLEAIFFTTEVEDVLSTLCQQYAQQHLVLDSSRAEHSVYLLLKQCTCTKTKAISLLINSYIVGISKWTARVLFHQHRTSNSGL